jgi:hypothetical protein
MVCLRDCSEFVELIPFKTWDSSPLLARHPHLFPQDAPQRFFQLGCFALYILPQGSLIRRVPHFPLLDIGIQRLSRNSLQIISLTRRTIIE